MGHFDAFEGDKVFEPTQYNAFAVSLLLYIVATNDKINENGQSIATLGENQETSVDINYVLECTLKYIHSNDIETFLNEISLKLNQDQKLCILGNMFDTLFADGNAAGEDQAIFSKFICVFDTSDGLLKAHFDAAMVKTKKAHSFN